jgi:diguanylate cyclase (GGDEF)-like protein
MHDPHQVGQKELAGLDLATLVWSSGSVIAAITTPTGEIRDVNATLRQLAGRDPRGENVATFVAEGQSDAFAAWLLELDSGWLTRIWGALPRSDGLARDFQFSACRRADGMLVLIGEAVATDDLASALLDVNSDLVEEHRRLEKEKERLDREGYQDALTGIANRRAFDARLAGEVELADAVRPFALVMLDVDHFKNYNDRFGHPAGAAVLRWLGSLLQAAARRGDLVARYGGEEFVAILPGADVLEEARWADRLRSAMRDAPAEGVDVAVTISAGVAAWALGDRGADVIARADKALYSAKRSGRDRVVAEGVPPSPPPQGAPDLPRPIWDASSIGIAIIEGLVVRRVNPALIRLLGHAPDDEPAGSLVAPDQAPAFEEFVGSAGVEWTRATFGVGAGARDVSLDHVAWVRRRGGTVELLLEPAAAERGVVEEALLELLNDLVEVQRELQRRATDVERALAESATARRRIAHLERRLAALAQETNPR